MPVPKDPEVRRLRARIAATVRWGDETSIDYRHLLNIRLVENDLRDLVPTLNDDERNRLALVALGKLP